MADLICRWRNGTPRTVVELVNSLPHSKMTNETFREFMQHSQWGNDFFRTPYQLACQLGLYCEAEDGFYYPRFDHDISEQEAQEYLEFWLPRYYVPNPYVGRNGFNDIKCPTYVLYELYKYATQHKNCTYKEAYEAVFQEKPANNNDIVRNYINNYSKVLCFEANGQLTITNTNPNIVFDFMDRNNKKEFFENFSNNNGTKESLLVDKKNLTAFVLSTIQYFDKFDYLNALIPYSSITSPIKVSKEGVFSLTGMFLESNLEDIRTRNSVKIKRWFEDQFTLGERIVFLSTQWNANGDYQLTLDDFIKMIQCCYGTDYIYKTGPNGEHQLYLVSKKANNDLQGYPLQQIFYGAPGTGKSHEVKEKTRGKSVIRTTFHPDSDYSTFVGAYKPTMKPVADKYKAVAGKDEDITYEFVPQAFLQAYIAAWNNQEENVFLVIEEINRGNCAQIFGDLFQLLDRDKDGFSEYSIKADRDLAKYLKGKDENGQEVLTNKDGIKDDKLKLPKNLYIWATMNTSDQSLFPIDSAFKRRWDWVYMPIAYKNSDWTIEIGEKKYNWVKFQRNINESIYNVDNSEDKQLGDYFVNADRTSGKISSDTLLNKILFYIWNDVCKDDPDQIFRWKDNNQEKSIKFSEFFGADRDKKLQGFMDFHKVPDIEKNTNTDNSEGDETNGTPTEDNNE